MVDESTGSAHDSAIALVLIMYQNIEGKPSIMQTNTVLIVPLIDVLAVKVLVSLLKVCYSSVSIFGSVLLHST